MKILITGAAGGIGSTLGYYLHKKGHDLILVDNLRNGYLENLKIDGETFGSFYQIDINSIEFYGLVKEKNPEVVVHLAAITSLPDCEVNSGECIRINVEGTVSVIEACRKSGVFRIIFASTSAVYENTEVSLEAGFDESDDINPRLFYSLSKKMAEEICLSYIQNYGMDILILRFFNVFGPKQDIHRKSPPLINYIVREFKKGRTPVLHSDGNQSRDYVYSEDVAETVGFNCRMNVKNYIGYAPALWAAVDGCAELNTKLTGIPSGVKVIDAFNIEINLTKGNAVWLRGLTDAVYSIIPKEVHSGLTFKEWAGSDFVVDQPVGTGPYTLKKFKRNAYLEFDANPNYFGGKPKIDKIFLYTAVAQTNVLPMLQKGELDLAIDVDASMEEQVDKLPNYNTI
jgi:nucleoside-diphosphate-sugar epimerase